MSDRKTSYKAVRENQVSWIEPVQYNQYGTLCYIFPTCFKINVIGLNQVDAHSDTGKNKAALLNNSGQTTFQTCNGKTNLVKSSDIVYSSEYLVMKAEIVQALHIMSHDYSFACTDNDNERSRLIFPDLGIVRSSQRKQEMVKC